MSDETRQLRGDKNTLTIRAYRAEDLLDELLDALTDWNAAYRSGLLRGSHITEERLSEVCIRVSDRAKNRTTDDR